MAYREGWGQPLPSKWDGKTLPFVPSTPCVLYSIDDSELNNSVHLPAAQLDWPHQWPRELIPPCPNRNTHTAINVTEGISHPPEVIHIVVPDHKGRYWDLVPRRQYYERTLAPLVLRPADQLQESVDELPRAKQEKIEETDDSASKARKGERLCDVGTQVLWYDLPEPVEGYAASLQFK